MSVAVIEIMDRATSREGTKNDGTRWGPFWSQLAYVHGQASRYPAQITIDLRDANSAFQPGFYLIAGSAISTHQPQGGKGFPYTGIKLNDLNALIPLGEGLRQLTAFMDERELVAA